MSTKNVLFTLHKHLAAGICLAFIVTGCGGGGGGEDPNTGTQQSQIHMEKSVTSLELGGTTDIEVTAVDSSGNTIPFDATWNGNCASVSYDADMVTVTAGSDICSETITIEAGDNLTKTITVNVLDPMTMDIGEGLLIKFVNTYFWRWNDADTSGDQDVIFWHPNAGGDGWYSLGSYIRANYSDVNVTKDAPMIVVKDSNNAGLLAAPATYELIWNDDDSGGRYDGSVWKPICADPDNYVALGVVVQAGWAMPSTEDVRCVRKDFTAPATFGARTYIDSGTGARTNFGAWPIVTPEFPTINDERAPLPVGTVVGCPNWDTASCDMALVNILLIPTPIWEKSENTFEPELTDYTNYDNTKAKFFSSIRVPFTLIPSLPKTDRNVNESPFYRLQRQERYTSLRALDNRQSATVSPLTYTAISTFDVTETAVFSQSIGMSVTAGGEASFLGSGGSWEVTLSAELGWEQSTATSFGTSTGTAIEFTVPAGAFAEVIQVETLFQAIDLTGIPTGPSLSAGKNTVKYLQYPR